MFFIDSPLNVLVPVVGNCPATLAGFNSDTVVPPQKGFTQEQVDKVPSGVKQCPQLEVPDSGQGLVKTRISKESLDLAD